MSLEQNLRWMEQYREAYWRRYPATSPVKLRWRALTVRHAFHVLPGESIMELGAGTGLWTRHLSAVTRGENPITAVVFNEGFLHTSETLPNVKYVWVSNLLQDLPGQRFDYIVGTAILCHNRYSENLEVLHRLLKPGGQLLFFEANYWNPQVLLKNLVPGLGRWGGNAPCEIGLRKHQIMHMATHQGFTHVEIIPYDIVHPLTPRFLIRTLQSVAFLLEHMPLVRDLCGTLYIWAKKPGGSEERRSSISLAEHPEMFGAISFVAPCHNEEMNVERLVHALVKFYDPYIYEIIIVNDNSSDRTAEIAAALATREPRVKLVNRRPPNGVGRALRDGYAAAGGAFILTMDSDFVQIVPEFRDLFDAVAAGHEGAIGSRFSYDSLLINYPFFKIFCNRAFHLLANLLLPMKMRDVSNNLKFYRADILKNLDIERPDFAANAETGLKPLLAGYDIQEVPISWINRSVDMGHSSFRITKVAPSYFRALAKMVWNCWTGHRRIYKKGAPLPTHSLNSANSSPGEDV